MLQNVKCFCLKCHLICTLPVLSYINMTISHYTSLVVFICMFCMKVDIIINDQDECFHASFLFPFSQLIEYIHTFHFNHSNVAMTSVSQSSCSVKHQQQFPSLPLSAVISLSDGCAASIPYISTFRQLSNGLM